MARRRPLPGTPISVAMAGVRRRPDSLLVSGVGERLGLGDPRVGPARQTNLFADLVRAVVVELGKLPVVEDAEVVELLLDRTRDAGELLEIVGGATRAGQSLELRGSQCGRKLFLQRRGGSADVD